MCHLDTVDAQKSRQDEDGRKEEDTLSSDTEKRRLEGHPYILEEHISGGGESHQWEGDTLPAESAGTYLYQHRIFVAEKTYDVGSEDESRSRHETEQHGGDLNGESVGISHTSVKASTIVESSDRLEPLIEAEHDGESKHHSAGYNGESADARGLTTRVGIDGGSVVETQGCDEVEELTTERWETAMKYLVITVERRTEVTEAYVHAVSTGSAPKEYAPADELAYSGGSRRTAHTPSEAEDEERVEQHVEDCPRSDAYHRKASVTLKTQLIVKSQRRHHERSGDDDETQVVASLRHHSVGRSQKDGYRTKEDETRDGSNQSDKERGEKTYGSHLSGGVVLLGTQRSRDKVARTMTEEESHSLDESHVGERDSDASCSFGGEMPHESSVDDIIESRHHHAHDGGESETQHQTRYRRLSHVMELIF